MKLDVLAFAAHPDDVELSCSGTLIKLQQAGKKVGIVDLTKGEMGTRGSAELRMRESEMASQIMKLDARENLDLGDTSFELDRATKLKVVEAIRHYQPEILFINAREDRHIDHPRAAELVKQAAFLSGLAKIETSRDGKSQDRWTPKQIFHYIQFRFIQPDFVVDITDQMETKMKAIEAYKSQFYDPNSKEKSTLISSKNFVNHISSRAVEMGFAIMKGYGEGFNTITPLQVNPEHLLSK
ncbi:MAG: bacillithiol biosynthesis deacetylase BshB1 [Bacteroidia bacterium]